MKCFLSDIRIYGKTTIKLFFIALLWSFVSQLFPTILIVMGFDMMNSYAGMTISLMGEGIGVLAMCAYYRKTPYVLNSLKRSNIKYYPLGFFLGSLAFISIWIMIYVQDGYYISSNFHQINIIWLLLFLVGYMIQSFFEELLCRGFVMGYWLNQDKIISAFLLNSLLFAFFHIGNPGFDIYAFIGLILFALLMSEIRFISGSIWVCGAFHAAWNFFEGSVFGTSVSGLPNMGLIIKSISNTTFQWLNGGGFGIERSLVSIVVYGVLVIMTFLVLIIRHRNSSTSVDVK